MSDYIPFVINGVAEKDIVTTFFASMEGFDTQTLLRCRAVSKGWRDAIDSHTTLWDRMPLWKAVEDNNRLDICEFIDNYPLSKKGVRSVSLKRSTITDAGLEVSLRAGFSWRE